LTLGTTRFVVKIVIQEHEVSDIHPLSSNALVLAVFIELFDSSSSDDMTPHPSSTRSPNLIFQFGSPWPQSPSSNYVLSYHHIPPPLFKIFNPWFLAYVQWCFQDVPPTSCKIWIMTKYMFIKSNSCRLFSMGTSYLDCRWCFPMFMALQKCRAWIENMMDMFGARWSQPISKIILG